MLPQPPAGGGEGGSHLKGRWEGLRGGFYLTFSVSFSLMVAVSHGHAASKRKGFDLGFPVPNVATKTRSPIHLLFVSLLSTLGETPR